jgi:hypothetical protein
MVALSTTRRWLRSKMRSKFEIGRCLRYSSWLKAVVNRRYRPSPQMIALCGASVQGYCHFVRRGREFTEMLKVGQVPSKYTLLHSVNIDLIYENVKYKTSVIQSNNNEVRYCCCTHFNGFLFLSVLYVCLPQNRSLLSAMRIEKR